MPCNVVAMRNYISYSLFGNDDKYILGAIENAKSIASIYPGWTGIFYCGASITNDAILRLRDNSAEVEQVQEPENSLSTLWRFRAIFRHDANRVLFRDTDSRLTIREALAVDDWLKTGKDLHIIRDHPNHTEAIMAGMWGAKADKLRLKENLFSPNHFNMTYGIDQEILRQHVYRDPNLSRLVHDSYFVRELHSRTLEPDSNGSFIGEAVGGDNNPDLRSRELIHKYRSSRKSRFLVQLRHLRKTVFDLGVDLATFASQKNS
jgi:hypothetical protein